MEPGGYERQLPPPPGRRGQDQYGYVDNRYMNAPRPPPSHGPPSRPMNRPPPLHAPVKQSMERAPNSAGLAPSRAWDSPFPVMQPKKRGNSFDLGLDKGIQAMNLNDNRDQASQPPVRPHTSNSNRSRPVKYHLEPLPPIPKVAESAEIVQQPQVEPEKSSPHEANPPAQFAPPKRSATMPVEQMPGPNRPQYPGQKVWQEPSIALGDYERSTTPGVPPRPATTTGVRPAPAEAPKVPDVPATFFNDGKKKLTPEEEYDYVDDDDDDDLLDHYLDPPAESEPDMPNFDAMDGPGNSREETLIPFDPSSKPGSSRGNSDPVYTGYQSPGTASPGGNHQVNAMQGYPNERSYQYDPPPTSPRYYQSPQGSGYGYAQNDPYAGGQDSRGVMAHPSQRRPTPGGHPQHPSPGSYQQGAYGQGYPDPREMHPTNSRGSGGPEGYRSPDSFGSHPPPFRPGLEQASKPPPIRQYDNAPTTSPPPGQVMGPISAAINQRQPQVITFNELHQIQQAARSNSADHAAQLLLAKKYIEASVYLIDDNGRADTRTKNKNRERYIFDAHKIIKKLVSAGYAPAMFYMADCYGQGLLGLEADPKEAFNLYQSAAKMGHAESAYRLAVCCEMGHEGGGGTRRDPIKAVQWYRRAAALGDTPAMYKMGMILLKGLLGQPRNPREALSWLKRAAERADEDNPHALHELALLYENPNGNDAVIRDENYARELLHQAAELGYKFSQFRLAVAYEYGLMALPVDARQSIIWYTRAAAQGEHQSELALSGWYLTGAEGILQQSDTEAYLWARKAAMAGLAKAEYAMGYFTEVGIGVPANLEDAKRWYWKASSQNFIKARERLEDLKRGGAKMQKTRVSRSAVNKQNEGDCSIM